MLQQCLESIAQKVSHTGVVLRFEKQPGVEPSFPTTGGSSSGLNGKYCSECLIEHLILRLGFFTEMYLLLDSNCSEVLASVVPGLWRHVCLCMLNYFVFIYFSSEHKIIA